MLRHVNFDIDDEADFVKTIYLAFSPQLITPEQMVLGDSLGS